MHDEVDRPCSVPWCTCVAVPDGTECTVHAQYAAVHPSELEDEDEDEDEE